MSPGPLPSPASAADPVLQAYLLGSVEFEVALALQRHLVYQVGGERDRAALVLCQHPPLVTIGRHGSRRHLLAEPEDLRARQWRVRWVNRGGGCWLHVPGQIAIYPVVALDRMGLGLRAYLDLLEQTIQAVLDDFGVRAHGRPGRSGVWVGDRLVAGVGVAVHDWVTYYGAVFNVDPALEPFRLVRAGAGEPPMTSLVRERRGPLRGGLVRERFLEHFARQFGFARTTLFSDHPALSRRRASDALAARS